MQTLAIPCYSGVYVGWGDGKEGYSSHWGIDEPNIAQRCRSSRPWTCEGTPQGAMPAWSPCPGSLCLALGLDWRVYASRSCKKLTLMVENSAKRWTDISILIIPLLQWLGDVWWCHSQVCKLAHQKQLLRMNGFWMSNGSIFRRTRTSGFGHDKPSILWVPYFDTDTSVKWSAWMAWRAGYCCRHILLQAFTSSQTTSNNIPSKILGLGGTDQHGSPYTTLHVSWPSSNRSAQLLLPHFPWTAGRSDCPRSCGMNLFTRWALSILKCLECWNQRLNSTAWAARQQGAQRNTIRYNQIQR